MPADREEITLAPKQDQVIRAAWTNMKQREKDYVTSQSVSQQLRGALSRQAVSAHFRKIVGRGLLSTSSWRRQVKNYRLTRSGLLYVAKPAELTILTPFVLPEPYWWSPEGVSWYCMKTGLCVSGDELASPAGVALMLQQLKSQGWFVSKRLKGVFGYRLDHTGRVLAPQEAPNPFEGVKTRSVL